MMEKRAHVLLSYIISKYKNATGSLEPVTDLLKPWKCPIKKKPDFRQQLILLLLFCNVYRGRKKWEFKWGRSEAGKQTDLPSSQPLAHSWNGTRALAGLGWVEPKIQEFHLGLSPPCVAGTQTAEPWFTISQKHQQEPRSDRRGGTRSQILR